MRLVLCVFALLLAVPSVEAAAAPGPKKRKRCEVVVFTRAGKTVRRCRLTAAQRRRVRKVPAALPAPPAAPVPVGAPPPPAGTPQAGGSPSQPVVVPTKPDSGTNAEERPRDPWFLTLYARDVGNGDFRLTPAIDDVPAGRLVLSYKNEDPSEHDLRLRGLDPASDPRVIFEAFSGDELKRTELTMQPGRYELFCGLPGHEAMRQPFTVTP